MEKGVISKSHYDVYLDILAELKLKKKERYL
jgi:hypothetical protein